MKKMLYKVTAYHCPSCGGITRPEKKYCDYCGRELKDARFYVNRGRRLRMLVECGNDYINFNEIKSLSHSQNREYIDCSALDDKCKRYIYSTNPEHRIDICIPMTIRGIELYHKVELPGRIHKVRCELLQGNYEAAFEVDAYINFDSISVPSIGIAERELSLISCGKTKAFDKAIPQWVFDEFTCPNCGAPIKSRFCACDHCGGWNEIEF